MGKTGERPATLARAIERGWLVTREVGLGKRKLVSATLRGRDGTSSPDRHLSTREVQEHES
jgi:hypothetical protein